ncbi:MULTISPECIES: 50S ribosomal protein L25/general stress protein Ctc [Streptomyces]|uniref:Large ribosomal subunit protein bL25 n=2 Tax=Streptomyces TaxID=1883 RepID=A0A1I6VA73_9ACTN|nr:MULTISPECIES: 50S ribosomal protein L25/general stress protein Ctc [Streptomyces]MCK1815403.1 50S ribosomal protein L25/general stress protein Ctc [Streptomyces sp. XM4011]SFT10653.1 large subunit ribosomal protein L25 [Streptomyces harbinensis]
MADVKIEAEVREEFGKGASRRIRSADKVPAVIYGHGTDPVHVTLPGHATMLALKNSNVLITLDIAGRQELVIPKAVQRDPLKGFLVHLDLLVVKRGEQVSVEVPLNVEGNLAPGGGLLEHVLSALPVEAEATDIPQSLTVSVQGLTIGDSVLAKDVPLPKGTSLAIDGDDIVVQVVQPQAEEPAAGGAGEGEEASA